MEFDADGTLALAGPANLSSLVALGHVVWLGLRKGTSGLESVTLAGLGAVILVLAEQVLPSADESIEEKK